MPPTNPRLPKTLSPPYHLNSDVDDPSSVLHTINLIANKLDTDGPFHCVLAHSEGAAAALSTVLHRPHEIQCLILVAPFPPFDAVGQNRLDASQCRGPIIHVPSVVVHGKHDPYESIVAQATSLLDFQESVTFS